MDRVHRCFALFNCFLEKHKGGKSEHMRKRISQTCRRRVPLLRGNRPPGRCPLSGGNTGKKHFVASKNESGHGLLQGAG